MTTPPPSKARFSTRQLVVIAGVSIWLGLMIVKTGGSGFIAMTTAILFMAELVILASATRTVTLRLLAWLFLMGGAMMGVGYLLGMAAPNYPANAFVIPPMEETLKLAPALWILWRGRNGRAWSLGVTDLMLMGAASGAGFGLVEDAYIRHAEGWGAHIRWLPLTEISGGRLIVGHAIWTALSAMTVGWALLLRNRGVVAIGVGVCGCVWSILDHAANNYAVHVSGWSANFLNGVTAYGWISIYLFVIGFIAAIVMDLYVIHKALPRLPELALAYLGSPRGRVKTFWTTMLDQRMLAFLVFQFRRGSEATRKEIVDVVAPTHDSLTRRPAPIPG